MSLAAEILEAILRIEVDAGRRCGMGRTNAGCMLEKGHCSPVSPCFVIYRGIGYYIFQDEVTQCADSSLWPKEILNYRHDKEVQAR